MITSEKTFYDIEHSGDMDPIKDAIYSLKGKILNQHFDHESEQWTVTVEYPKETLNFWSRVQVLVDRYYSEF
jgi:hypothetical protein